MKLRISFLAIVLIQTAVLLFLIGTKQYTLNTGTQILLETQPIDPRSLFSGDYVRLNYTINNLILSEIPGDHDFKMGDTVYVTLEPGLVFWEPVSVSKIKPKPNQAVPSDQASQTDLGQSNIGQTDQGQVIIRGIAVQQDNQKNLGVVYGIEQYFVPEGEGIKLEKLAGQKQLSVLVKVDNFGHAAISGITSMGQEIYQEKLF